VIVQVGTASAKIVADVRAFARDAKRELDAALARLRVDPVEVDANTRPFERALDRAVGPSRAAGRRAGDAFSDGFWTDVNGRVHDERGRFVASMGSVGRDASQEMTLSIGRGLSGLGPSLALSPGVIAAGAAIGAVLGSAAITAFSGIILGAGLLGLGVFALLGGREERQKALEDLDKAKDAVKRAEEQAKSGSATSIRNLKEARQQLAETQKLVNSGKAFKELDDAVTNLGDTLKRVGQEAARPLLEPLTTGIGDLSELVDQLGDDFEGIFTSLAPVIPLLTEAFGKFSGQVVRGLADSMPGIVAAFEGFARILPTVGRWIGDFFRTIFGNSDLIDNITEDLFRIIFGPLKLLGPLISGLTVLFGVLTNAVELSSQGWGIIKQTLLDFVDGGTGALNRLSEAWAPLKVAIQNVWDTLKAFAGEDDPEKLAARFDDVVQSIREAWGPLKEFLGVAWDEAWAFIKRIWDEKVVPWWEETAAPWLKSALSAAMDAAWNLAKEKASQKIEELKAAALARLRTLPGLVLGALIGPLGSVVAQAFGRAVSAAISGAASVVSGAINRIRQLPGQVGAALAGIRSRVVGAFAGAAGWLFSAGSNIIGGLVNGIQAAADRVRSALGAITSMLPSWKGPEEVDRKILRASGQMVMEGFRLGLQDQEDAIRRQLAGLTSDLPSFAGVTAGGDGASAASPGGTTILLTIEDGAIRITGQGAEAGREAAEAILEMLGQAQQVR
jgi:hypothetical protein